MVKDAAPERDRVRRKLDLGAPGETPRTPERRDDDPDWNPDAMWT